MKRSLFLIMMLNALLGSLMAQNSPIIYSMEDLRFKKIRDGLYTSSNLRLSEIKGIPYVDESFISGKIITSNGLTNTDILLRYNAFTDDLEFKRGEDICNIDPKSIVKRAEFGGAIYGYMSFHYGGKILNGFFKILMEGKATLLARYTVAFLDKEEIKPFAEPKPARFDVVKKEYYLAFGNDPAKSFSSKKGLLELFGEKKDEMETFMSKNKLSVRGDESMIKIVAHYNSL